MQHDNVPWHHHKLEMLFLMLLASNGGFAASLLIFGPTGQKFLATHTAPRRLENIGVMTIHTGRDFGQLPTFGTFTVVSLAVLMFVWFKMAAPLLRSLTKKAQVGKAKLATTKADRVNKPTRRERKQVIADVFSEDHVSEPDFQHQTG